MRWRPFGTNLVRVQHALKLRDSRNGYDIILDHYERKPPPSLCRGEHEFVRLLVVIDIEELVRETRVHQISRTRYVRRHQPVPYT